MAELISTGSFASNGEQRAAEILRQGLPSSWLVICNKLFPIPNGRSFEIDFLVIGERWIFVIEEKSWQGQLRGNEEFWFRADGSSEPSPLAKVDYVAKIVAGYLKQRIPSLKSGGHGVHGVVLLSAPTVQPIIEAEKVRPKLYRCRAVDRALAWLFGADARLGGQPFKLVLTGRQQRRYQAEQHLLAGERGVVEVAPAERVAAQAPAREPCGHVALTGMAIAGITGAIAVAAPASVPCTR